MSVTIEQTQKQIVHLLQVYPVLSPTLIQALLGAKARPRVWKPIMEVMIKDGTLVRSEMVSENSWGQFHSYTCIRLSDK